jgi:hypothetical protein
LVGIFIWIVVDYTSTVIPDTAKWISFMPFIWIFYIGIPAIMALIIYRLPLSGKYLFLATLIELLIAEYFLFHNVQLFSFPLIFIRMPLAIVFYSFSTFMPKWIVGRTLRQHKLIVVLLSFIWILFTFLRLIQNRKDCFWFQGGENTIA